MSTAIGRQAEDAAANYLKKNGYKILAQNWRTRWCEIDIVAQKANVTYFVEVKYRASNAWGDGLEYITSTKLKQMSFAAEFWMAQHPSQLDHRLAAIAVTLNPADKPVFIDDLT